MGRTADLDRLECKTEPLCLTNLALLSHITDSAVTVDNEPLTADQLVKLHPFNESRLLISYFVFPYLVHFRESARILSSSVIFYNNNLDWGPVPRFCPLEALQPVWLIVRFPVF